MYGFAFIVILMAALMGTATSNARLLIEQHAQATVDFQAGQLPLYGLYVEQYALANVAVTGAVDNDDLTLPAWFVAGGALQNYVAGGSSYVYLIPDSAAQGNAIARVVRSGKNGWRVRCGIATGGWLKNPGAGTPTIPVPAAIPEGAVVMVM